jgi:putative hydrolase of the HAD superfamily
VIAVVTFDCWQTLLHERDTEVSQGVRIRCLRDVTTTVRPGLGEQSARAALEEACGRQFEVWHGAAHAGSVDVARWSLEALGIARPEVEELVPELARAFSEAVLECRVDPLPGSLETLVALRRAGVRTALVCDTGLSPGRVVRNLLERCGLLGELEALAFSDEVGVAKPDARIFEHALRALGAEASEATHVGDLLRTDVAGARDLGMRTVRIRAAHDDASDLPEADHVAEDHPHLREILGLG